MEEKTDLRIVKTQEAIHSSFEKLAEENELSAISVAELCREARISKKTGTRAKNRTTIGETTRYFTAIAKQLPGLMQSCNTLVTLFIKVSSHI